MKKQIIFILWLLANLSAFSQTYNSKIDSINILLVNEKNDVSQIKLILEKAKIFLNNKNFLESEKLSKLALQKSKEIKHINSIAESYFYLGKIYKQTNKQQLALDNFHEIVLLEKKITNKRIISDSYFETGYIYMNIGILDKAILYLQKSNDVLEDKGNEVEKAKTINNIGYMYELAGKYDEALIFYRKALTVFEEFNDKKAISYVFNNIGALYREIENYEKAIEYYNKSMQLKIELGDSAALATTYNNLGVIYQKQKKYDKSITYLNKALKLSIKYNDTRRTARTINNIGIIYELKENYNKALELYIESFNLKDSINENHGKILSYLNIGKVYSKMGKYNKSVHFYREGIILADSLKFVKELSELYNNLSKVYEKEYDFKNALKFRKKYSIINDTILNNEKQKNIAELEIKYQTEKNEEQLEHLQRENNSKEKILTRNRYLTILIVFILILTSLFLYVLNNRKKLKAQTKSVILEQNLLRTQMNPHFLFNSLSAIQAYMYENKPLIAGKYIADFAKLMRHILDNSRKEFILIEKEISTLTYYLKLQQLRFDNSFSYTIKLDEDIQKDNCFIPPMLAQPIIENAIEHGVKDIKDGFISIEFIKKDTSVLIRIKDNGKGFKTNGNKIHSNTSYALKIIEERLLIYDKKSKIYINSNNTGTEVFFIIPTKTYNYEQSNNN